MVPDNVLFDDGRGLDLRRMLIDQCDLHTILRLPTGIFYAQGVKTNVIFFRKGTKAGGNTQKVWVYDLRTNMPAFGKTNRITPSDFASFERVYGDDPTAAVYVRIKARRDDSAALPEMRSPLMGTIST